MEKTDNFAENLKAIRKARKLGQRELADLVALDKGTISRLERGVQAPRRANIRALAEALNCAPQELTGSGALYKQIMAEPPEEALLQAELTTQRHYAENLKRINAQATEAIRLLESKIAELKKGARPLPPPEILMINELQARLDLLPEVLRSAWLAASTEVRAMGMLVLTGDKKYLKDLAPEHRPVWQTVLKSLPRS